MGYKLISSAILGRPSKIDTPYTNVTLTNLQPDKEYELVVKSGNSEGTSVLSPPITFVMADNYVVKGKTSKCYTVMFECNLGISGFYKFHSFEF